MSILEQVLCDFLSLYHVEVSVVVFVCLSVCFYLCWVLYSVFVTIKRIYIVNRTIRKKKPINMKILN